MNKPIVLRVLFAALLLVTLVWAPRPALAGSHGGGGGFHGGGGGGGFHGGGGGGGGFHGGGGGHYYGGGGHNGGYYGGGGHNGGYYGGHGGYYGGHGGNWGYPSYGFGYGSGWGWGFGISFGWGSYWPGYGVYGYGAWGSPYDPYYNPYYPSPYVVYSQPAAYVSGSYVSAQPTAYSQNGDNSYDYAPTTQSGAPARVVSPPNSSSVTIQNAAYTPRSSSYRPVASAVTPSHYTPANSGTHQIQQLSPQVQNVIRALRAMPPDARQRQIDSGRYGNLSPQELEFAKYAADLPATTGNMAQVTSRP
ncbi:MAG TPA: hypothetical protein VII23_22050 [Terriglobales bacterium]